MSGWRSIGLALSLVMQPTSARADTPDLRVHTGTGTVRGTIDGGVVSFKGIPFAAAPVGPLRWRAPQPIQPWRGERDASFYRADCMQEPFPGDYAPLGTRPAEDCLYANIWRPAGGKRLPVMIWIHGGGFLNGGASPPVYSGSELARRGIMVVSFNYRLGRFGTFAHPALTKADADHGLLANYGYLDQISALRWVRRNITAFGGDVGNITVVGESAGGMSIHMLLTSPLAQGLFERAVIQSGGPDVPDDDSVASAEAAGITFARKHGISETDPQVIAKLRSLSAEAVTDRLNMAALFGPTTGPRTFTSPVTDGRVAVELTRAYSGGAFAHVPMMVGATADDIGGPAGFMIAGARQTAERFAAAGLPVYYYRYAYVASAARRAFPKGAGHATEIPFFFGTEGTRYGAATSDTDRRAAALASGYLVNFVKTGDPNGGELPRWPVFSSDRPSVMTLAPDATAHQMDDPAPALSKE